MVLKYGITHEVLVFELWGLVVPVLPPAVVGVGVVPGAAGELAAGELAAGLVAAGLVAAGWEPDGAEAADDEPAAAQRDGSPANTVKGA